MVFICYPKCSTCQKAKKWLDDNGVKYDQRDIKLNNPTKEELKEWHQKSGLPLKRFFNASGLIYKELELSKRLGEMSADEQLSLLATNGMLVKRPIIASENIVLVGFKEPEWSQKLK